MNKRELKEALRCGAKIRVIEGTEIQATHYRILYGRFDDSLSSALVEPLLFREQIEDNGKGFLAWRR